MKENRKAVIFLADGMADDPQEQLGGKTPLEYANTPGMDFIASSGVIFSGTLLPPHAHKDKHNNKAMSSETVFFIINSFFLSKN